MLFRLLFSSTDFATTLVLVLNLQSISARSGPAVEFDTPLSRYTVVSFGTNGEEPCPKMKTFKVNPYHDSGRQDLQLAGKLNKIKHEIHWGSEVWAGELPFLAMIMTALESRRFICTGALWTARHVISAAHCMKPLGMGAGDALPETLRIGPHMIKKQELQETIAHPEFKDKNSPDYLIVILAQPMTLGNGHVETVCIFLGDKRFWEHIYPGPTSWNLLVAGWGRTEENKLPDVPKKRWMHPQMCSPDRCLDSIICLNSSEGGVCVGDSGGPVLGHYPGAYWVHVAINTYGKVINGDCSFPGSRSISQTLFYFYRDQNGDMKNPWCDFFMKHIQEEPRLVLGTRHPHDLCQSKQVFQWCDYLPPTRGPPLPTDNQLNASPG